MVVFHLFETYGIPFDLTFSILDSNNINYNKDEIFELLARHKEVSRKQVEKKFGDGINDNNKTKLLKI